ncbi:MAG: hypothetical protein V4644_01415 [Patescibacteria group bacterium]
MGTMLKVVALVLVLGGLLAWAGGMVFTPGAFVRSEPSSLAASPLLAEAPASSAFDEQGTIVIDPQGQNGTPYILYTHYTEGGKPSVRTKRLIFRNQDQCADLNLPCASDQPGTPVAANEAVRIVGTVKDEAVEVEELYRL